MDALEELIEQGTISLELPSGFRIRLASPTPSALLTSNAFPGTLRAKVMSNNDPAADIRKMATDEEVNGLLVALDALHARCIRAITTPDGKTSAYPQGIPVEKYQSLPAADQTAISTALTVDLTDLEPFRDEPGGAGDSAPRAGVRSKTKQPAGHR